MAAGPGICSLILKIKPSNSTFSISIEGDIFTSDYPTSYSETSSDFSVSGEYLTKTYAIGPGYGHTISIQYNNKTITERVSPLSDDSTHTMIIDLSLYDNITLTRDVSKDLVDCVAVKYNVEGKPEVLYAWDYEDPYDNADTLTIYTTSPTPIVGSIPCDENGNKYGYSTIIARHAYILDPTIDEVSDTMISITSSVEK